MKAEGRLRHRFHGRYSATVGLAFADEATARAAGQFLGPGWTWQDRFPYALAWTGSAEELERVKEKLGASGLRILPCGFRHCADRCSGQPIDSIRHSVDYGPRFTVDVDAAEDPWRCTECGAVVPDEVPGVRGPFHFRWCESWAEQAAEPARMDEDRTAEPRTKLRGVREPGVCCTPTVTELEDVATGGRTKLV